MTGRSPEAKKRRQVSRSRAITAQLTAADAAERRIVRLPDGRTARLVAVSPTRKPDRSRGKQARVLLGSGAYLSVPLEDLVPFVGPDLQKPCQRCREREATPIGLLCRACRYYTRGQAE